MMDSSNTKYIPYFAKTIVNKLDDDIFSGTINPYRGCEHACRYCYVLSDKYNPYEESKHFSTKIQVKSNAVYLLKKEFEKGRFPKLLCIGSSTDPYQNAEKKFKITQQLLELCLKFKQPVHIFTKSELILRDIELLKKINKTSTCVVSITIVTLSEKKSSILEPDAPSPSKRLQIIKKLSSYGIKTGLALMPVIPYITDDELEDIVKEAKARGVNFVIWDFLNLREGHRENFLKVVKEKFPKVYEKILSLYKKDSSPSENYVNEITRFIEDVISKYGIVDNFPEEVFKNFKEIEQGELFK